MTTPTQVSEDPQATRARARLGMVLQEKWKLESVLGVGGMAAVYAATHRNGKRVAVKMLHAELGHDDELKKRFLQEGYAANTIQHDGAVSVLDDDTAPDGSAFIVMELLEGQTIDQRWERAARKMPLPEVLAMTDQLLSVLDAAHTKNVVHRDIKPENLFLTKSGVLKVLDFGIARVHEAQQARAESTRVGVVMGTPAFMAPEQARGRWDEVDGRTDLWAVGATMFTLISGRFVHEGTGGNEQLILSATTPAVPLASVVPDVPGPVAAIVDRALAFERDRRWPDAPTMQQAVRLAMEALGWNEPIVPSGNRPVSGGTIVSSTPSRAVTKVQSSAATLIDTTGKASAVSAWTKERELRVFETGRVRAAIAELQQQYAAAKRRTAGAEERLEVGRNERTQLEQWFKRQVGTRTAAVEEARGLVRTQLVQIAKRATVDRATFGAELDAAREQIGQLERAAESAARDVSVHEAALVAHEVRGLRRGVVLLGAAAVLLLALLVVPIVWRATRVVEPPPLPSAAQVAPKQQVPAKK
jgi:eukaryotic-like serine/threonine-protein kinase